MMLWWPWPIVLWVPLLWVPVALPITTPPRRRRSEVRGKVVQMKDWSR